MSRMRRSIVAARMLAGIFFLMAASAKAYDYEVKAVPPDLRQDAATTFLADFSKETRQAAYAAGETSLEPLNGAFVAGGGFRGSLAITLKTYELGVGDHLVLPADIEVSRAGDGYTIRANVPVKGTIAGKPFEHN